MWIAHQCVSECEFLSGDWLQMLSHIHFHHIYLLKKKKKKKKKKIVNSKELLNIEILNSNIFYPLLIEYFWYLRVDLGKMVKIL